MLKEKLLLTLYPIMKVKINEAKQNALIELLQNEYSEIKSEDLIDIFYQNLTKTELENEAKKISANDRNKVFQTAKKVLLLVEESKTGLLRLAELGKALGVPTDKTGYAFNLYNTAEINQTEFIKTIRNFSLVSAAIGFIPFIPISDYTIIASIQIGMLAKIANIYNFKLDPRQFIQMVAGTLGAGFALRIFSKILTSFVPVFGWFINAGVAYAGTYAIGILLKRYIEADGELTADSIKTIWEKSFEEGKGEFWQLKNYIFQKKEELLKELEKYKSSTAHEPDQNESVNKTENEDDETPKKEKPSRKTKK